MNWRRGGDCIPLSKSDKIDILDFARMKWAHAESLIPGYMRAKNSAIRIGQAMRFLTFVAGVVTAISTAFPGETSSFTAIAGVTTGIVAAAQTVYTPEKAEKRFYSIERRLCGHQDKLVLVCSELEGFASKRDGLDRVKDVSKEIDEVIRDEPVIVTPEDKSEADLSSKRIRCATKLKSLREEMLPVGEEPEQPEEEAEGIEVAFAF
ncbi:MAG: hypothetical protein ACFFFC_08630 [Candidatus Thorarchaeota archaeon]